MSLVNRNFDKKPEKNVNRSIRIFVSSTFRDMIEDRNELMTHCWPELRKFCTERELELTEVDLRWGITEEQSTRKDTLKLCLDEIKACRPFFIGLLGERYGWIPENGAFTADLREEQPWLNDQIGKSVTELEILHGVLQNPEMAERSYFFFRDPGFALEKGGDFLSENEESAKKQNELKALIRKTCAEQNIPLYEDYSTPQSLAQIILEQLKAAIEILFPMEEIPDPIEHEACSHEFFAEIRRRTYIGRNDYYKQLADHCKGQGKPLVLLGNSGSGKSALFANWVALWRKNYPGDYIFQHYISGTPDSSSHWKLMLRLIKEIKRWTDDHDDPPRTKEDTIRSFPVWLSKAQIKAGRDGVRFIIILDALNQLDDIDHGRLLGWLPEHSFTGSLRLIISTLPGETLTAVEKREWPKLHIQPLSFEERSMMISNYLARFGKKLDNPRLNRISALSQAANPLYLKILLDELRVTGTHDKLDERLNDYLAAQDIPSLLQKVLKRYQQDYERDRPGLVKDALGLIWAARRGLTESELLHLLKPDGLPRLPFSVWAPLRAALEESLVDRGGILNFAHDFLRDAVENAFLPNLDEKDDIWIALADYFEAQPISTRICDELPWLLKQAELFEQLRKCLLNIDYFLGIHDRNDNELRDYWVFLNEEKSIGRPYLDSFNSWIAQKEKNNKHIAYASGVLGSFLNDVALYAEAEAFYRLSLRIDEQHLGPDQPIIAVRLNNLAELLRNTNRLDEAEALYQRALRIFERSHGMYHYTVASCLNNLAQLYEATNRSREAESLFLRALEIMEQSYGMDHPSVAVCLNNFALLLEHNGRLNEAELLFKRALRINENYFGMNHPLVAKNLNNLGLLLKTTDRIAEAESLFLRALWISENSYGTDHPLVAANLDNLAQLMKDTNRFGEAELLYKRALKINAQRYGSDHPNVAKDLNNLAQLLQEINRFEEAETLIRKAIMIDEKNYGIDHPAVAVRLHNLAQLLQVRNRLKEAEPLMLRALKINEKSYGHNHPSVASGLSNLGQLLQATNRIKEAEPIMRRALEIQEECYGKDHSLVATNLNNLAQLLQETNRYKEAEPILLRALAINEKCYGMQHPAVALNLNNLAQLYEHTGRFKEAEPILLKAIEIYEKCYGLDHPSVAGSLNNLAMLLKNTNRLNEAEPFMMRSLRIHEKSYGMDHPKVAICLNNLAQLLETNDHLDEAESLYRRALKIVEQSYGMDHPTVAGCLNNLSQLLETTNRLRESEPLARRVVEILFGFYKKTGHEHPHTQTAIDNYVSLLQKMGWSKGQIIAQLIKLAPDMYK